jgi:peptidoglycan/xylan/chitin deacetylase (PgdA/CDA1 family)
MSIRNPRVPILTYHAMNISGNSYESNDHVAFAADLELIRRQGFRICPLMELVQALEANELWRLSRCVAITFDDGSDFDFHDLRHPKWGLQKSMLTLLKEAAKSNDHLTLEATSFVIISPQSREELDSRCMSGRRWWNDDWWALAEMSGLMRIESHSFDHNHETLTTTVACARRGTFNLTSIAEANAEIAHSNQYLFEKRKRTGSVLFAYPYGEPSAFLVEEYFPRHGNRHNVRAAFTTAGSPVTTEANIWAIPRYVCGCHWKCSRELETILEECA